jgi:hypothetical protein
LVIVLSLQRAEGSTEEIGSSYTKFRILPENAKLTRLLADAMLDNTKNGDARRPFPLGYRSPRKYIPVPTRRVSTLTGSIPNAFMTLNPPPSPSAWARFESISLQRRVEERDGKLYATQSTDDATRDDLTPE